MFRLYNTQNIQKIQISDLSRWNDNTIYDLLKVGCTGLEEEEIVCPYLFAYILDAGASKVRQKYIYNASIMCIKFQLNKNFKKYIYNKISLKIHNIFNNSLTWKENGLQYQGFHLLLSPLHRYIQCIGKLLKIYVQSLCYS